MRVRIPWRRRDADPQDKALIVTDAGGREIANVVRLRIERSFGDLVFETIAGPGEYHVYFLPWKSEGRSNYPTVNYPRPARLVNPGWARRFHVDADGIAAEAWRSLPEATPVAIESVDEFNSFYPMEVIATPEETEALLAAHPDADYLLFPEDRRHPIRLTRDLPLRWIEAGPGGSVFGEAMRGEWYAFQVGVWAARAPIADISTTFNALVVRSGGYSGGAAIPVDAMRCVTTGGTDWTGAPIDKVVHVPRGHVQSLWCGIQLDEETAAGTYVGRITVALSLIHISEPTRLLVQSRMPSSA